jgi:hypothetical protein
MQTCSFFPDAYFLVVRLPVIATIALRGLLLWPFLARAFWIVHATKELPEPASSFNQPSIG